MANAKASPNLQAIPTSPSPAQTLPGDAVLDALKMILLGAPLNEVLTTITRLIEAHSEGMLGSIFLVDEDGLHLRYGVAENLPQTYRAATDGICIDPNVESSGAAAYLRQPVFVADILSDPKWVKFKDSAWQLDCAPPGRARSCLTTARCWEPLACSTGKFDTRELTKFS